MNWKIYAPTDKDTLFILRAIADECRYCHTLPGDSHIGYTEAAYLLEEYIAGKLDVGDFDSPEVHERLLEYINK